MMKKKISIIIVVVLIIGCFLVLSGCNVLIKGKQTPHTELDHRAETKTGITIVNDDETFGKTVEYGTAPTINPYTKRGYYYEGVFDSEVGGTKYFDTNGNAVTVWKGGYPSTLYVRYIPISELHYVSTTQTYDSSIERYIKYPMPTRFINALEGNKDKNVIIKVKFTTVAANALYEIKIVDSKDSSAEVYAKETTGYLKKDVLVEKEFVVSSRCMRDGYLHCNIVCMNVVNVKSGGALADFSVSIDFEV